MAGKRKVRSLFSYWVDALFSVTKVAIILAVIGFIIVVGTKIGPLIGGYFHSLMVERIVNVVLIIFALAFIIAVIAQALDVQKARDEAVRNMPRPPRPLTPPAAPPAAPERPNFKTPTPAPPPAHTQKKEDKDE